MSQLQYKSKVKFSNLFQRRRQQYPSALLVAVIFAAFGAYLVVGSHAATPFASSEAEAGTHTGAATTVSDSNASGGSAVKFGSGSGSGCASLSAPPYPCSISSNHRYLLDQTGKPYMIVGDSPQSASVNLSTVQMDTYFADRQAHGFNTVLIDVICGDYTGNKNANAANFATYDGITPFTTNGDISTPNPVYFDRMKTMVQLAANHGLEVMLDPAETGQLVLITQFLANNGATKDFNYGIYLGNTFKSFSNVMWQSGNDYRQYGPGNNAFVLGVAQGIRSVTPAQLQTVELTDPVSLSTDDSQWASFVDLNGVYSYASPYSEVLAGYNHSNPKSLPVMGLEYDYEGENNTGINPGSTPNLRRQEYWTMTSGATGQLYGSKYTWQFLSGWQTNLDTPGVQQLQYMTNLFSSVAWQSLVPDQGHSLVTAGYGTFQNPGQGQEATDNYVTAGLTADGSLGMAYLPQGGTITVNMAKFRGSTTARWHDPTTGTYTPISGAPFTNSGNHSFTAPAAHGDGADDWVLVLQS